MSRYLKEQLKAFGMVPSFAFVREPKGNGVAKRFIRTLKEQIVFGRIYQNFEEVRAARQGLIRVLQPALAAGKERLPKPSRNQADVDSKNDQRGRITLPCVQKPGAVQGALSWHQRTDGATAGQPTLPA